jgi:hypothetical protein
MSNEDKVAEEMAELVLDAYRYALENNMDITSREDVTKIVKIIRPEIQKNVDINVLIEGLVAFDRMTKTQKAKRRSVN